ncbi:hypothetical protein AB0H12_23490 [Actinosynnema sp. NPDC023794]
MPRNRPLSRRSPLPVATLGALVLIAPPANAADTDVPCDPSALVAAVAAANASTVPDTLSLAANCVYTLTAPAVAGGEDGLPAIAGKLTIHGNGATIARAADAPQFRLISNWGDLSLDHVTLTGGRAPDAVGTDSYGEGNQGDSGGAIQNWGPLTISDSVVTGNVAGAGAPGADATATTARAGRGGLGGSGGAISSYSTTSASLTITDSTITGNASGPGGRGGNGIGQVAGGRGGSGGFGGGVHTVAGTALRISGGIVRGNAAADGGVGGSGGVDGGGGGDGGSGGTGGGVDVGGREGQSLSPSVTSVRITANRAGRGGAAGAAGPGGYAGWAGFGGSGGGVAVYRETLALDRSWVSDNAAGEAGAGSSPWPGSGGGIHTLYAQVALANGTVVTGNRPNNCDSVADVPGCTNVPVTVRAQRAGGVAGRDRQGEDRAHVARGASAAAR